MQGGFDIRYETNDKDSPDYNNYIITMRSRVDIKNACVNNKWHCGALIEVDNWQIKDDYPW